MSETNNLDQMLTKVIEKHNETLQLENKNLRAKYNEMVTEYNSLSEEKFNLKSENKKLSSITEELSKTIDKLNDKIKDLEKVGFEFAKALNGINVPNPLEKQKLEEARDKFIKLLPLKDKQLSSIRHQNYASNIKISPVNDKQPEMIIQEKKTSSPIKSSGFKGTEGESKKNEEAPKVNRFAIRRQINKTKEETNNAVLKKEEKNATQYPQGKSNTNNIRTRLINNGKGRKS